MSRFVINR